MRWRRRSDDDFAQEIEAHLQIEADRLIAEGASPEEARRAAGRAFGSVLAARERHRETRPLVWLEQVWQDLRYACRVLVRVPGFLFTAVGTLALGLAVTTLAFAVVNAYVLRSFAVRDPGSLVEIGWLTGTGGGSQFSVREIAQLRARTDLFDDLVGERGRLVQLDSGESLSALFVSGSYFPMLQPAFAAGRGLDARDDDRAAGDAVGVLGHEVWRGRFGADPAIVGRVIRLNGHPVRVIGVLAAEFTGLDEYPRDVWLPLAAHRSVVGAAIAEDARELRATGRLRAGVRPATAAAALEPLLVSLLAAREPLEPLVRVRSTPLPLTRDVIAILAPLFVTFALVLVASCANVSNMLLARALERQREIGVRLAIGAGRGRVVRQLLTEGLAIAGLACGLALLATWALLPLALSLLLRTLPPSVAWLVRVVPLDPDLRVFVFAAATATLTTIIFALLPALQGTRLALTQALRGEGAGLRASTWRNLLVAGQVAVSLLLVVLATTLVRNAMAVGAVDLGYRTSHVVSINQRGDGDEGIAAAGQALRRDPRMAAVAATSRNPLFGAMPKAATRAPDGRIVTVTEQHVSPEYFAVLDIAVQRGRGFESAEAAGEAPVGILNAAAARAIWGDADPIGRTIRVDREDDTAETITIVGIAEDVVSTFVYVGRDPAHLYRPTQLGGSQARALLLRGHEPLPPSRFAGLLRQAHADPMAFEVIPLAEMQALQLYPLRAASWVGTMLGALALGLSISGLYGVLAFTLRRRVREIGIRMALGAPAGAVVRLVVGQSARLAALGAAVGAGLAAGGLHVLSGVVRLQAVSVLDGRSFLIAGVLVAAGAAVAAVWPARRATRVDPAVTLRADG